MQSVEKSSTRTREPELPAEIYIPLVDALYSDSRSLFVGSAAVCAAATLTAWKTGELFLLFFAAAIVVVTAGRALDMRAFWDIRPQLTTVDAVRRWESRYIFGAAVYAVLLGSWTFATFYLTEDPFSRLFSFVVTLAYMVGTPGRNFASNRLVTTQIICEGIPLSAALFYAGGFYYAVFGLCLLPFFAALKFISDRLRKTLLDAVIGKRDLSLLAGRFDTALNNMPHGLGMFDADHKLVVTNRRLVEILGIAPDVDRKGFTTRELLRECVQAGTVLRSESERLATDLDARLSNRESGGFTVPTQEGRTLNFTFQPMANGGNVVLIEDVTERKAAEARISHLARYDSLTGLPNRMFLRERMEATLASANGAMSAVLFVDLDQFKGVNDTLGHPRGDLLLRAVADRLRRLVRESDIVARFGGDEFVVLQTPTAGPDEVATLARRIVAALGETYEVDGHQVVIGATIGIAMAPRDASGADHLLKNADMALYWAKTDQRGTWRFFEPGMDVRAQARRSLELDLRNALANNAFEIYYQPLFDLKTMKVTTCEALLRWPHPTRGMIPPSEFIPVAEEMGLIVEIGNWVLHQACLTCATWPDKVRVAVNLSANQFRRGSVINTIRDVLGATGLAPSRLELEITESLLFQDTRATRLILRQLRDLGVRVSLDDFGTGYSSLSYLHSLPLNKVKIDRSFLEGLEAGDRALILLRGVAKLSAELGLTVTVEGIETEQQLAIVAAEEAIDEAQGYLFSVPVPSRQIREMLIAASGQADAVRRQGEAAAVLAYKAG
jgi:diguanylate cyclase (GGDEF)-like protein